MAKIHLIADDSLGGTLREYVEVERKAEVGDFIMFDNDGLDITKGIAYKVKLVSKCGKFLDFYDDASDVQGWENPSEYYHILEPTDIVHIGEKDGKSSRYKLVDRKAEVGEKILVIRSRQHLKPGTIGVCTSNNEFSDGSIDADLSFEGSENEWFIDTDDTKYLVLVPLNPESTNPQSYEDIIANLVRRVAELERHNEMQRNENRIVYDNIEGIKDDIVTWSQEHENLAFKVVDAEQEIGELKDKIEMCIDERSQPKQVTLDVDTFTKIIGGARG